MAGEQNPGHEFPTITAPTRPLAQQLPAALQKWDFPPHIFSSTANSVRSYLTLHIYFQQPHLTTTNLHEKCKTQVPLNGLKFLFLTMVLTPFWLTIRRWCLQQNRHHITSVVEIKDVLKTHLVPQKNLHHHLDLPLKSNGKYFPWIFCNIVKNKKLH